MSNKSDLNYLNMKIKAEETKIKNLQSSLHFTDQVDQFQRKHIIYVNDENECRFIIIIKMFKVNKYELDNVNIANTNVFFNKS